MTQAETPFNRFWRALNDARASQGLPELRCGEAERKFRAAMATDDMLIVQTISSGEGRIWA